MIEFCTIHLGFKWIKVNFHLEIEKDSYLHVLRYVQR